MVHWLFIPALVI